MHLTVIGLFSNRQGFFYVNQRQLPILNCREILVDDQAHFLKVSGHTSGGEAREN